MFVVPPARGRGVARALLTELERRARSLGYSVVRLDTGPLQATAQLIYDRAGYEPIGNFNSNPIATYFGEKHL
jgi:GNAT superfamily N-acetyltransferase